MNNWLESVYSDGTKHFVSNPRPKLGETVDISIRVYEWAPIDYVFLRAFVNGDEDIMPMTQVKTDKGLAYYQVSLKVSQPMVHYHFYLVAENKVYYYTQKDINTYIPDHTYDFKLLADYMGPTWVKGSVFYQIFPDRFFNGNADNDVQTGEYDFDGHKTYGYSSWNQVPKTYEEAFCLDFYGGDLEGIEQKLDYLQKLGVNALYINPIFYAATAHRYDCLDYLRVDPHLGGDQALVDLSKALHDRGMRLVLDISINHTGTAHKWFNKEGTFYDMTQGAYHNPESEERSYYFFDEKTNGYKAWYDVETLPTLNYTSSKLRDSLYREADSVIQKWLKPPYEIDGWRFDVANVMARNDAIQLHHEVWPEIRKHIKTVNPQAYILGEDWSDCSEFLQGNEWDSAMNYYGCTRLIRQFAGDQDLYMARNEVLREIRIKPSASDLHHRLMQHLAKLPTVIQENQFNLLDSHDIYRLHNNKEIQWGDYRGAVIMLFTLIGASSIYYGDEVALDGRVEDTEGFRYPMQWEEGVEGHPYYQLYQKLGAIKGQYEAFRSGGFKVLDDSDYVLSYARFTEEEAFLVVCSNDDDKRVVTLPIGALGVSQFTKETDALGTALSYQVIEGRLHLEVAPHTSYLFQVL